jgi:hypothetical protein
MTSIQTIIRAATAQWSYEAPFINPRAEEFTVGSRAVREHGPDTVWRIVKGPYVVLMGGWLHETCVDMVNEADETHVQREVNIELLKAA